MSATCRSLGRSRVRTPHSVPARAAWWFSRGRQFWGSLREGRARCGRDHAAQSREWNTGVWLCVDGRQGDAPQLPPCRA